MWILFPILVSALVFKSEKNSKLSIGQFFGVFSELKPGRCDLMISVPVPCSPSPTPDSCSWSSGASLGIWLLFPASNLWSCSYSQSMALLLAFPSGPLVFPAPQSLSRCHRTFYNTGIPCDHTVSCYLALAIKHSSCGSPEVPRKNQVINFYRFS